MDIPFMTVRFAAIFAAVLLSWVLPGESDRAHAQSYDGRGAPRGLLRPAQRPPPPAGTRWVRVSAGMTGFASFAIGDPNQLEVQPLSSVDQPQARVRFLDAHGERGSFRFSIGAHHRFKSLDLGAKITHQLAQPTMLEGVERRLPGYVEGLLHLRWRFFDRHWGAFYGGIGLGGAVSRPSRGFRASVAFQFEGTPDLTATDERLFALAASSSAGVLVYHGDDLGFFLEFVGTVIAAEYRVADHDALISGRNECIQAGVTWSL